MSIPDHPLAALIPEMTADQFAELKADIQQHGLMHPIVLHEHMVLDGRHRLRACEQTETEPRFKDFNGPSPVGFVISTNLKRRHLTPGQLAAVGLAFKPAAEAEAKARQGTRTDLATCGSEDLQVGGSKNPAREAVAKLVGVSGATIDRAQRVQREDPDMFEQVKAGTLTVTAADTAIRERKASSEPRPPRPVNPIKQRRMPPASDVVPKVVAALRVGAGELDRALNEGTTKAEEAADWSRDLSEIRTSLTRSINLLKEHL